MDENHVTIVDDLFTKCVRAFLDAGYVVQIYPIGKNFAIVAMRFGVQGAHYISSSLEDAITMLLKNMKDNDEGLKIKPS